MKKKKGKGGGVRMMEEARIVRGLCYFLLDGQQQSMVNS